MKRRHSFFTKKARQAWRRSHTRQHAIEDSDIGSGGSGDSNGYVQVQPGIISDKDVGVIMTVPWGNREVNVRLGKEGDSTYVQPWEPILKPNETFVCMETQEPQFISILPVAKRQNRADPVFIGIIVRTLNSITREIDITEIPLVRTCDFTWLPYSFSSSAKTLAWTNPTGTDGVDYLISVRTLYYDLV